MTNYNIRYKDESLAHAGKKGMKWGFNDGKKNGKRTAEMDAYESEQYINGLTQDQVGNMDWSEYNKYKKAIKKSNWNKGKKKELYSMGRSLRDYYRLKNFDKDMSGKNRRAKLEAKYAIGKAKTKDAIDSGIKNINKKTKKVQKNVKKKAMKVARRIDKIVHPDDELIKYNKNPVTGNYVIKSRTKVKNKNRWFK